MLNKQQTGFTIVELLIVIVVIGILAAITIVAFNGIQNRTHNASVTSDLNNFNKQVQLYYVDNQRYPVGYATITGLQAINPLKLAKPSYDTSNNAVLYCTPGDGSSYALIGRSKGGTTYFTTNNSTVKPFTAPFPTGMANDCPTAGVTSYGGSGWLHHNGAWESWVQG